MGGYDLDADFGHWVLTSRDRLVKISASILKDRTEAEDVVQDTLVSVWHEFTKGNVANLDAYASRSVWLNSLKMSARRRHFVPLNAEILNEKGIIEPSVENDEERIVTAWDMEQVIASLPLYQQTVIRLKFYSGMTFREIAYTLQISINTAASRCRNALAAMKKSFNKNE